LSPQKHIFVSLFGPLNDKQLKLGGATYRRF